MIARPLESAGLALTSSHQPRRRAAARRAALLLWAAFLAGPLVAQVEPESAAAADSPHLDGRIGVAGFLSLQGDRYDYMVDSTADIALRLQPDWLILYRHRDHTPFFSPGPVPFGSVPGNQPDNLTLRDELRIYRALSGRLALGLAVRHEESYGSDYAGSVAADSAAPIVRWRSSLSRAVLRVEAEAGPLDSGERELDADAYWELHLGLDYATSWSPIFWNVRRPWIAVVADAYGLVGGEQTGESVMVGPELVFLTDSGNEVRFLAKYWHNDGVPFDATLDTDDALLGLALASPRLSAAHRESAGEPFRDFKVGTSIQGRYDVGLAPDSWMNQLALLSQLVQFDLLGLPLAVAIDYTHRRVLEWDSGGDELQNTSYLVAVGLETALPAQWQGLPLVAGVDFTHRSDHALDVPPERLEPGDAGYLPAEGRLENGNINVFPRFRLETQGWDDPMLPAELAGRHGWLGRLGWRVTAGSDGGGSRDRGQFAGQLSGHCDLVGFGAYALYVAGAASIGNESPDWAAELGARTRRARVFGRFESWGVTEHLGGEDLALIGMGWGL